MLSMCVSRLALVAFMAMLVRPALAIGSELEDSNTNDLKQRIVDAPEVAATGTTRTNTMLQLISLVSDFAARSTTYSSLLTLNVANVIILALIAFVALGYFGFLDFDSARSMARSASASLIDSEVMDTLMQGVELALEKFQHLDTPQNLDSQL
ncbi:unnamed protein product [Meganyctiphanes norvegica]|uniref:Transmembrane protein n=1 Tax=Meganyctiphanes norvegica TaxID=48144 RepID=A0AAV2R0S1_MEGNR